ncbi:S8 family serine peptidase [Pilimelia columellifera subsp. columellifera]|uniref:S8 family serine peptidase n=1 Tax=Pilimelia columellifera subsp. columellifera TaxID=706583 RepID=A0ABP6AMT3_9ACTN
MLAAGLLAGALAVTAANASAAPPAPATLVDTAETSATPKDAPAGALDAHDLDLLAEAEAENQPTVDLIVATRKGRAAEVARGFGAMGGLIATRNDKLGYLRTRVATSKVRKAAKLPGIFAVDLDEQLRGPDPRVVAEGDGGANTPSPQAPGANTPAVNAFMPTEEMGAVSFVKANPRFDGRGVTIGVLDSGVAIDHPALQKTTTGERKIVDWFTATSPLDGLGASPVDGTWLRMNTEVTGPEFTQGGQTFTAPAGSYRFALFAEKVTDNAAGTGDNGGDVNRDGDKTDTFGVLFDPQTNNIWVDSDADRDFTDGETLRPYSEKFQIGAFGVDKPETPVKDAMPFTVEFRKDVALNAAGTAKSDFVNIGIVDGGHGTHVAGITAANDLFGNAVFDGVAPGAKIVSARACTFTGGCTAAALTDGLVELVSRRKVDVVNISIGGLPALNDGNNARAELYDRLITDYGVQLFISAGNSGPGVNTIGDPSVASKAISVGAAVSKDTWLHNYGSVVRAEQALFPFSSRGPREDGGFKPNIVAPGSAISTTPMWTAGGPAAEAGYGLPAGYAMYNGTSMSSPQAAGAGALLLSAAKGTGAAVTPAALRRALYSTARTIAGEATYEQGHGQVNVGDAWKLLAKAPLATREYSVDAPVCTPLSDALKKPHRGDGLYNRCGASGGGHKIGQSRTYKITLTRTSGQAGKVAHNVAWKGNDGTFSGQPKTVKLDRNVPVTISVKARPTAGAHSAILLVDDPKTTFLDFEMSAVVVAADELVAPSYSTDYEGAVERSGPTSYFVNVPKGAAALKVNLSGIATSSQTRFIAINPYGVPVDPTTTTQCYTNLSDAKLCNPQQRVYAKPIPGIWEIEMEARRTSPTLDNPYTLAVSVFGVDVNPATLTLPVAPLGKDTPAGWDITNRFGSVSVTGKGGPLSSAAVKRPSIRNGEQLTYTVEVPAGVEKLTAAIKNPSDRGADLDLSVLRNGVQVGADADGDSDETVTIANPQAGTYTVVVDGYAVPTGTTEIDYLDAFSSSTLGSLTVTTPAITLASGATVKMAGMVSPKIAPAEGRKLLGDLTIVTADGAQVGSGNVVIDAVS